MESVNESLEQIIKEYCSSFNLNYNQLFKNKRYKKPPYSREFSYPFFRMALGYFLYNNFPVTITEIAYILGYTDHSTLSYHRKTVRRYIENKDEKFLGYYERLNEIAKPYLPEMKIFRPNSKGYFLIQTKTDEHYGKTIY